MPYIKLVTSDAHTCGDYGDTIYRLGQEITDWEEISENDLAFLKKNKYELWSQMQMGNKTWDYQHSLIILELDRIPVKEHLADLKLKLADRMAAQEEAAKKRLAQAAVRKEQKAAQKAAQERKQLAELAKKHGLTIPGDNVK